MRLTSLIRIRKKNPVSGSRSHKFFHLTNLFSGEAGLPGGARGAAGGRGEEEEQDHPGAETFEL